MNETQMSEIQKEELKRYIDARNEKIESKLNEKVDAVLIRIDTARADAYDDVKELRDDIKEQRDNDNKGRRWFIAIVLGLTMSAVTAVGGYFISTEVISTKVDTLASAHTRYETWHKDHEVKNDAWHAAHHDKIERSSINADDNKQNILQLRQDFRTYVKEK